MRRLLAKQKTGFQPNHEDKQNKTTNLWSQLELLFWILTNMQEIICSAQVEKKYFQFDVKLPIG